MRAVSKQCATRSNTSAQRHSLINRKVRDVFFPAQSINHQSFHTAQLFDFGVVDVVEIGKVGRTSDSETNDRKAVVQAIERSKSERADLDVGVGNIVQMNI